MAVVDFSFPTLHKNEWVIQVVKKTKQGGLFSQNARFENKDDAFKYYEQVRQLWRNQNQR